MTLDEAITRLAEAQATDASDTAGERDRALRDVIELGIRRLGLRLIPKRPPGN